MKDNTMNDGHLTIIVIFEYDPNFSDTNSFEFADLVESKLGGKIEVFDWKQWKDASAWEDEMNSKGYEVRNIDDGSDSYNLIAIPNAKVEIAVFIAKSADIPLTYPKWEDWEEEDWEDES